MMQELTVQVGALVGTSVLLYLVMAPRNDDDLRGSVEVPAAAAALAARNRRMAGLRGGLQYSAVHRKRYESLSSSMSSSSHGDGGGGGGGRGRSSRRDGDKSDSRRRRSRRNSKNGESSMAQSDASSASVASR